MRAAAAVGACEAGIRGGGTGKWVKAELTEARDDAEDGVRDRVEAGGWRAAPRRAASGRWGLLGAVLTVLKSMWNGERPLFGPALFGLLQS